MDTGPRDHHYAFAHRVLPAVFYSDPGKFFEILNTEGSFLRFLWKQVGSELAEGNRLAADELRYDINYLENGTMIALVTLPSPQGVTEAYFVAIVYRPPARQHKFFEEKALVRFITLEYGAQMDGAPRTVLCEWNAKRMHLNLGDGPEPKAEAFLEAVYALLQ